MRPWVSVLSGFALAGLLTGAGCGDFDRSIGKYVPPAAAAGSGGEGGASSPTAGSGPGGQSSAQRYFEAEDARLSGDWLIGASDQASAGHYIESAVDVSDPSAPGNGVAHFEFEVEREGDYVIWGRTHGPGPGNSRYFLRIDAGDWIPWRISTGDVFWWDDMHRDDSYGTPLVFLLAPGTHVLEMGNSETGAQLDRIYVTGDGDVPPGNAGPCNPPHSIQQGDACVRACGTYGNTSCDATECSGRTPVPVYDCAVCCVLN
jgi:hypothetical protein